jgi:hypothetical protein
VPQADEAVPAWTWKRAFSEQWNLSDRELGELERRARELAKEGQK